jgi:hypothetical protein
LPNLKFTTEEQEEGQLFCQALRSTQTPIPIVKDFIPFVKSLQENNVKKKFKINHSERKKGRRGSEEKDRIRKEYDDKSYYFG